MNKLEFINKKLDKDFYIYLPKILQDKMENIILEHSEEKDFIEKWNEYRNYVLSCPIACIESPDIIFNNGEEIKHSYILDYFTTEEILDKLRDVLSHSGVAHDENPPGRGSGRYPYGSGKNPFQHQKDETFSEYVKRFKEEPVGNFSAYIKSLEKRGISQVDIAESLNLSTTELRKLKTVDKNNERREILAYAKKRDAEGISREQIAEEVRSKFNTDKYKGESGIRSLLNSESEARMNTAIKTAEELKKIVDEKGTLDIGSGIEAEIGITRTKLDEAVKYLELEGYQVFKSRLPQATNKGKYTTIKVLARSDVEHKDVYDWKEIGHLSEYTSPNNGDNIFKYQYPKSMDSKRLMVRFEEDGGTAKDGLVEIRRNVKDLSLGDSNYAQVRILVDDKYYIKGMAVYGRDEDFPEGIDVIFNSNKPAAKGKLGALKSVEDNLKKDPTNPFGSTIKEGVDYPGAFRHGGQSYYLDENGKYQLSLINKREDEGGWGNWSKELPSQMLSKQPIQTITRQLNLAKEYKEEEYEKILEITNPVIKRGMLKEFADKCDRAAIDLKAAPFPEQKYQVILPLKTIKDGECYAPNYADGQELALIRYPHGGTFEIPIVKVNNRNKEAREIIASSETHGPLDAIGINANTAHRLSGADFDGDTVMVIPLKPESFKITSHDELEGLKNFDPTVEYGPDPNVKSKFIGTGDNVREVVSRNGVEYKVMLEQDKQMQMGVISNLITDMTLGGASEEELAAAVRHSMVVIDAVKHKLDVKQSEIDNGIQQLHKTYQGYIDKEGHKKKGASTIISRAKNPVRIPEKKEGIFVANDTGHVLTEIDSEKKLYLDELTGVIYRQKDKHTQTIDPETGKKLYRNTNKMYGEVTYKDANGKTVHSRVYEKDGSMFYKDKLTGEYKKVVDEKVTIKPAMMDSKQMAEVEDAFELSSGKPQETAYALYANKMKSMANEARKEALSVRNLPYSPSAAKTYKEEVDDLESQYLEAIKNKPKERQAQMIAASELSLIKKDNPHMSEEEETKLATRILEKARGAVGAKRREITISPKQWEAIQAGAIHSSRLEKMFDYVEKTNLRQLATPYKHSNELSKNQQSRMKSLARKGYTIKEIADVLGCSTTTVEKYLSGEVK